MTSEGTETTAVKRCLSIDVARGIAILLVVAGHSPAIGHVSWRVIHSFHMPLFFFLSGMVFNENRSLREVVAGRARTLLLPVMAVICVGALVRVGLSGATVTMAGVVWLRSFYGTITSFEWGLAPLWFLLSLFVTQVVYRAIAVPLNWRLSGCGRVSVAACLVVLGFVVIQAQAGMTAVLMGWWPALALVLPGLPWNLDLLPLTLGFFMLGRASSAMLLGDRIPARAAASLALTCGLVLVLLHLGSVAIADIARRQCDNLLVNIPQSLAGIGLVVLGSRWLSGASGNRIASAVAYMGLQSLGIMVFHHYVQTKCFYLLEGTEMFSPWLAGSVSLVAGVVGSLIVWEFVVRRIPLLSLAFGRQSV